METPVQILAAPEATSPSEEPARGLRRRLLPVALAALVLAPGVLLAAPLKHAFADFMAQGSAPKVVLNAEPIGEEGAWRRALGGHGSSAVAATGGSAPRPQVIQVTSRLAYEGLLKLTDLQTGALNTSDDATATLVGDDDGDSLMSNPQREVMSDVMSGSSISARGHGRGANGGGFGGFGGLGEGGGAGAQASQPTGAPGLGDGESGPSAVTDDPSQLGAGLGAVAGVPEPSAWVSLIVGFGLAGSMLRRRRKDEHDAQR